MQSIMGTTEKKRTSGAWPSSPISNENLLPRLELKRICPESTEVSHKHQRQKESPVYFLTQHTFIVGKNMSSTGDEGMSPVDKIVCLLRVAFVEKKWRENNMSQRCIQLEENETKRKRRDWMDE